MKHSGLQNEYPEVATLISDYTWNEIEDHHPVKFAIINDSDSSLDYYSKLLDITPSEKIATSYEGRLGSVSGFEPFLSELVGFVATGLWLCDNPTVLDVKGEKGKPEFACEDFDVEVARIRQSREMDRFRAHVTKEFGDGYHVVAKKKLEYDDLANDVGSWTETEKQVDQLIKQVENVDESDIPVTVETEVFKVEIRSLSASGYIEPSHQGRIEVDSNEKIVGRIEEKRDKVRDERPLIVFLDLDIHSVDYLEEVEQKLIGHPHQGAQQISQEVQNIDSKWNDYLEEMGAIYGNSSPSAIRPGKEGLFEDDEYSYIAGVMFRLYSNEVGYVPNVYTRDIDAKGIYDHLGWGRKLKRLSRSDIMAL